MARLDVNRSGEMEVFVRVVELGGFSAAARAFRMTPSAVSKLVARLEARLGTRLVNRSTRRLQLTPEGGVFYERSVRLLADLDEAERCASANEIPAGRLRVNTNFALGRYYLLPLVPEFLAENPAVTLDIALTDEVVDLMEERTDVAIRSGELKNSRLIARKLGGSRLMIVASPDYLARHGTPRVPADLAGHNLLGFSFARYHDGWPLMENGREIRVPVSGNLQISDGDALMQLALAGLGLARLSDYHARGEVAAGRLVPVLEDCNPGDIEPVHAVFLGQGGHLPARVRAFLDFLVRRLKI